MRIKRCLKMLSTDIRLFFSWLSDKIVPRKNTVNKPLVEYGDEDDNGVDVDLSKYATKPDSLWSYTWETHEPMKKKGLRKVKHQNTKKRRLTL